MTQPEEPHKKALTWLVAEDDPAIRDVISTMCELWQFSIIPLKDGYQAMEYLDNGYTDHPLPDIALLDIRMPGLWGHEVSARIRQHPSLHNIGIILMTAYELPGDTEKEYLTTSGADRIVYKPLPPMEELRSLAESVIQTRNR